MNTVDWILIGALAIFALAGWRQGFVAGVLSFTGFLGGGIAALMWMPSLIKSFVSDETLSVIVLGISVLAQCDSWTNLVVICGPASTGSPNLAAGEVR